MAKAGPAIRCVITTAAPSRQSSTPASAAATSSIRPRSSLASAPASESPPSGAPSAMTRLVSW